MSDGLRINGTSLAAGLSESTGEGVTVTGGLAGDAARFETTWVLADGQRREGVVAAVGLYGDALRVTTSSMGGWDPFGPERVITKSHDNILEALDGRPALELYKEYLGDRAEGLPSTALLFPLSIRVEGRAPPRSHHPRGR